MKARFLTIPILCVAAGCGKPLWIPPTPVLSDGPEARGISVANAVYSTVLDSAIQNRAVSRLLVADRTEPASPAEPVVRIDSGFAARVPVLLVPAATDPQDYPNAAGVFSFSSVRFDADSTHAFVRMAWKCGFLCGAGFDYSLARKPGRSWVVIRREDLWRS